MAFLLAYFDLSPSALLFSSSNHSVLFCNFGIAIDFEATRGLPPAFGKLRDEFLDCGRYSVLGVYSNDDDDVPIAFTFFTEYGLFRPCSTTVRLRYHAIGDVSASISLR